MFRSIAITLTLCFATVTAQAAPVKYQYQGPDFNAGNSPVDGLTAISGYFVLAEAIAPNSSFYATPIYGSEFAPIEIFFTNGVTTITSLSELNGWMFEIETDVIGAPSMWQVNLGGVERGHQGDFLGMRTLYNFLGDEVGEDVSEYCNYNDVTCSSVGGRSVATDALNHGTWTITVVPAPAAVWLFGSALGLMGWMRRKTIV